MRKWVAVGAVVGVVAVGGALWWVRFPTLARIGAGYTAEQTCACLFVSGRTMQSCRGDLDPLAVKLVRVKVESGEQVVRASVAGMFGARARFDAKYGCTLEE